MLTKTNSVRCAHRSSELINFQDLFCNNGSVNSLSERYSHDVMQIVICIMILCDWRIN